jgi:hypothetical protein
MANASVHVSAARKDRSLLPAKAPKKLRVDVVLTLWRRMIDTAVADAKRTKFGLPTDGAIMARLWLEEFRPAQDNKDDWGRSLACACSCLGLDVEAERKRLLGDIDAHLHQVYVDYIRAHRYARRAALLTCAGVNTAVQRQYVMPLVDERDYEDVAGVEHPDPPARRAA